MQVPDYEGRLSKFERMCVVKTFREDRTLVAAADYISDALGQRFVESVPLNMERAWAESHKKCPLICLLSPGEWLAATAFSWGQGLRDTQGRAAVRNRQAKPYKADCWHSVCCAGRLCTECCHCFMLFGLTLCVCACRV